MQNSQEPPPVLETPTQVFSCEYYKIFLKSFFIEHLRTAAIFILFSLCNQKKKKKIEFTKIHYGLIYSMHKVALGTNGLSQFIQDHKRSNNQVVIFCWLLPRWKSMLPNLKPIWQFISNISWKSSFSHSWRITIWANFIAKYVYERKVFNTPFTERYIR